MCQSLTIGQCHGLFYRFGRMLYLPTYLTNLLIYKFTHLQIYHLPYSQWPYTHLPKYILFQSIYMIWIHVLVLKGISVAWWKCRIPSNVKPSLHWSWQLSAAYMIVRAVVLNGNVKLVQEWWWCEGRLVYLGVPSLRVRQLGHYIAISKGESDTWTGLIKTTHGTWTLVFRPVFKTLLMWL